tara:strand:+ start:224 stop:934 length:711 start_codon:yes stop_codon:yes gene_type:complete
VRLDKYVSNSTDHSRVQVKRLIKAGAIKVNDNDCSNTSENITAGDLVTLHGELVGRPGPRYFMLNKPQGYVCATRDGLNPTVLDLLDEPRLGELQVAGRLDLDTTGLVLITDDGKWNHAVTSPKRRCQKIYHVTTSREISADSGAKFAEGLWLDGEKSITLPATLETIYSNECRVGLSEGRYHQVKRMFAAIGNHVENLHRESVGAIALGSDLEEGCYRVLTQIEIDSILSAGDSA